jgi:hypothetical protein
VRVARIVQHTGAPGIKIVRHLVQAIVYPTLSYVCFFWIPTASQMNQLRSCVAQPLRVALGLPFISLSY